MKRTVLFALAMALPAMAGSGKEAEVNWYYAEPERPLVLEVAGVHTWTMADAGDDMHNMNMGGVDATLVYKLDDNWATTLRFGWAEGRGRRAFNSDEVILKRQLTNWAFTGGVRYTAPVSGKLSWFAAANLGLGRTEIKDSWFAGEDGRVKAGADDVGLYYSAELGLKYDICDRLYAIGSVGVRGVWTTPNGGLEVNANGAPQPRTERYDQQFGMSVSGGLGWAF